MIPDILNRRYPGAALEVLVSQRVLIAFLVFLLVCAAVSAPSLLSRKQLAGLHDLYGRAAVERIEAWQSLLVRSQDLDEIGKLARVNNFLNNMDFLSDMEHWGKKDYWATPIEFIATAGGDCEDFSIAKYFSLRELGVPTEKLRLIYVKAVKINQAHMVLGYYESPDAEPLILDNLKPTIQPASQRTDLIPSYSFNANSLWQAKMLREGGKKVGKSENIGIWKTLVKRMQEDTHAR